MSLSTGLLRDEQRAALWNSATEAFANYGAFGFLEVEGMVDMFGVEIVRSFLTRESAQYDSLYRLYGWLTEDLSSSSTIDSDHEAHRLDVLDRYETAMASVCTEMKILDAEGLLELKHLVRQTAGDIIERFETIQENNARRDDHYYEQYKETWKEERHELEHGLFSDVDE